MKGFELKKKKPLRIVKRGFLKYLNNYLLEDLNFIITSSASSSELTGIR